MAYRKVPGLDPARKKAKMAVYYNKVAPSEPEETYSPYPVLGWRIWVLAPQRTGSHCDVCRSPHGASGERLVLTGVYGKPWPEAYLRAECYCSVDRHQIPEWNALCGIYATKVEPWVDRQSDSVAGIVALSDVIEHETGYRAAEARILALTSNNQANLVHLREAYPDIDIVRSPERILRVWDYYTRNPDQIPPVQHPALDERNHYGPDWKAPAPYPTDAGARDRAYYQAIQAGAISREEARRRAFPFPITDA